MFDGSKHKVRSDTVASGTRIACFGTVDIHLLGNLLHAHKVFWCTIYVTRWISAFFSPDHCTYAARLRWGMGREYHEFLLMSDVFFLEKAF